MKKLLSFTLIELLIVIVIIGILATSLIPRLKGLQDKAKYARVEKDFSDLRAAVLMAHTNTGKPLKEITGSSCSACNCPSFNDTSIHLPSLTGGNLCRVIRIRSLKRIEEAAGLHSGALGGMETDPWGSPYILDENEGENHNGDYCAKDKLRTVGSDGIHAPPYSSDNKTIYLAQGGCYGGY